MSEDAKKPISNISELREAVGLTQAQLAVLVGVTTNTIQNWESGKSGVDQIVKFLKLCEVLDCEMKDLVKFETCAESQVSKAGDFSLEDLRILRKRWSKNTPPIESAQKSGAKNGTKA